MMSIKKLAALVAFLVVGSEAIQGPCGFKNVSIMGGISHKPIATPSNCGMVTLNASELATEPNVILHSVDEAHERTERYTFMLLEEIPAVRDTFKLRWLVSHATPLKKSLTANQTHIEFAKFNPPKAEPSRTLKLFLFVYKENKTNVGPGLVGLGGDDLQYFAPQKWVSKNHHIVGDIVGGVEFFIAQSRAPGQMNTHGGPVSTVPIPMQPGWATGQPGQQYPGQPGQQYPGQQYPGQQYPGQPGHVHPSPPGQVYPGQPAPAHPQPGQALPPAQQPTVINNYYGKQKDEKKKKNNAANALPMASLVAILSSVAIFRL
ncbi:Hypothetical protein NTJ_12258 [Nesidiocoris tenuis]|uniref:Reelin domain-containing protein n=1 Tax=Nesidiocoris tenuis TaxID=355587 RepID=A0ABN7B4W2_9HEMI|nr:Hypothetical protein NTJ_12258 [Nesidiocoris tenuis]